MSISGADRGSRARRSRPGRLCRLPSRSAADAGFPAAARAQPSAKVLDLEGRVRCRGCGAKGRAVVSVKWAARADEPGEQGCSLRQRQARRDVGRWCVSARAGETIERPIAGRLRPARWLRRPRATGATQWSKTRHRTNDWGRGSQSIEPLTVDPRSRRPLTELCCPPVPP